MKILITGAHGFVGNRLMQDLDDTVAAPSMRSMSEEQIRNMIEKSRADVIIHTAAISDVGTCEKNPGASYEANVRLPLFLAKAAKEQKLICFSSDQVYRGCAGEGRRIRRKMPVPVMFTAGISWRWNRRFWM